MLRPSSPLGAKASTKCPSTLDLSLSIVLPILLRRSQYKVFKQPASLGATQAAQLARSAQPLSRSAPSIEGDKAGRAARKFSNQIRTNHLNGYQRSAFDRLPCGSLKTTEADGFPSSVGHTLFTMSKIEELAACAARTIHSCPNGRQDNSYFTDPIFLSCLLPSPANHTVIVLGDGGGGRD